MNSEHVDIQDRINSRKKYQEVRNDIAEMGSVR